MTDEIGANASADQRFASRLPGAVADWQTAGIITEEQATAILERYEVTDAGPASRGRLISILVTLGAVLIGLGVILFFAANWQEISKEVKLALSWSRSRRPTGRVIGHVTGGSM